MGETDRHEPSPNAELEPAAAVRPQRVLRLDALRGVAILLVLGHHIGAYHEPWGLPRVAMTAFRVWQTLGWMGVDLFFVLSGFLVAGLLFAEFNKHGRIRLGRFFIRRGFKIYPAFYVMLVATAVALHYGGLWDGGRALHEALFIQNYAAGLWPHTWSLAVEEHFYLLAGLSLAILARKPSSFAGVPAAVLVLLALLPVARLASYREPAALLVPAATHLRVDGLLAGVLLAYFHHFHPQRLAAWVTRRTAALAATTLVAFAVAVVYAWRLDAYGLRALGLTALSLGFAALLLLALRPVAPATGLERRGTELLAWVGFYSYSIYLWHVPAAEWFFGFLAGRLGTGSSFLVGFAFYMVGTVAAGVGMAKLVEGPCLALRDRLYPSLSGSAVTAPDTTKRRCRPEPRGRTARPTS